MQSRLVLPGGKSHFIVGLLTVDRPTPNSSPAQSTPDAELQLARSSGAIP